MGLESNNSAEEATPLQSTVSGGSGAEHLVVCCDFGYLGLVGSDEALIESCVVAPMRRYGGVGLLEAGSALYFEFVGFPYLVHSATRAALEVAARIRNLSAARDRNTHLRIGISIQDEVDPGQQGARRALMRRAREASALARDSEILAEYGLALLLDYEVSCSIVGLRSNGTELVSVHGMRDGGSRMLQARRRPRQVIGRGQELALVQASAELALAGQGRVVGMCGRQGSGKTFLLSTIADRWIRAGGSGFINRCKPSTQRQALHPVFSCLRSLAGMHGHEDTEASHRGILDALRRLGGTESQIAQVEGVVSGGLGEDAPWYLIGEWLGDIIEKQSQHVPVLLIFEDMQFADPGTLRFLSALSQVARRGPILVITTYQASRSLGNLRRSLHAEIVLPPMPADDLAEIVRQQARASALDSRLVDYLASHGNGTPGRQVELVGLFSRNDLLGNLDGRLGFVPGAQARAAGMVQSQMGTPPGGTAISAFAPPAAPSSFSALPRQPALARQLAVPRQPAAKTLPGFCARRPTSRTR